MSSMTWNYFEICDKQMEIAGRRLTNMTESRDDCHEGVVSQELCIFLNKLETTTILQNRIFFCFFSFQGEGAQFEKEKK